MAKESAGQRVDRINRGSGAVLEQLTAHANENGNEMEAISVQGQVLLLCRDCGYSTTIDTIKAEANKAAEPKE